jgi:hypothetical protein
MWKEYGRTGQVTGNITWSMGFLCWITKATHTLRISNTYCFSTATVLTQTRLSVTLYVHCLVHTFTFSKPRVMKDSEPCRQEIMIPVLVDT